MTTVSVSLMILFFSFLHEGLAWTLPMVQHTWTFTLLTLASPRVYQRPPLRYLALKMSIQSMFVSLYFIEWYLIQSVKLITL